VAEAACTGAALGASISGMRPIVVHPRMDFMMYASDALVNQAAKWSHMFGGQAQAKLTIRAIINRGGEQGAQHSQALHAWYAHVPGLRVVMPTTPADARDLLIASVMCNDPVVFIDDRWLYDIQEKVTPMRFLSLENEGPQVKISGTDFTIVASGYSTYLAQKAIETLSFGGLSGELIDTRVLAPLDPALIIKSVLKTGRLLVVDGGTRTCGYAAELIASTVESIDPRKLAAPPTRLTLPDAPAPTASSLERLYYPSSHAIVAKIREMFPTRGQL